MDALWYYARRSEKEQQGPVPEEELRSLIADGTLGPRDRVWTDRLPDWTEIHAVPELAASTAAAPCAPETSAVLPAAAAKWMRVTAVLLMVNGVLQCLVCVGLFSGILLLAAGMILLSAVRSGDLSPGTLVRHLTTFFQCLGIALIVMALLALGFFLLVIKGFAS